MTHDAMTYDAYNAHVDAYRDVIRLRVIVARTTRDDRRRARR